MSRKTEVVLPRALCGGQRERNKNLFEGAYFRCTLQMISTALRIVLSSRLQAISPTFLTCNKCCDRSYLVKLPFHYFFMMIPYYIRFIGIKFARMSAPWEYSLVPETIRGEIERRELRTAKRFPESRISIDRIERKVDRIVRESINCPRTSIHVDAHRDIDDSIREITENNGDPVRDLGKLCSE